MALLCRYINRIVTPFIYATIYIGYSNFDRAAYCLRTLTSAPQLVLFVRTFDFTWSYPYEVTEKLRERHAQSVRCLACMTSLRHLRYHEWAPYDGTASRTLSRVTDTLESLSLRVDERSQCEAATLGEDQHAGWELHLPRLKKLTTTNQMVSNHTRVASNHTELYRKFAVACSATVQASLCQVLWSMPIS